MRIFVHSGGLVDLEAPIHMDEDQRDVFVKFFRDHFNDVKVSDVAEAQKIMGDREVEIRHWTSEEYASLFFPPFDNEMLAHKLRRTPMSIQAMRGSFCPRFLKWLGEKGYSSKEITPTLIVKYQNDTGWQA